MISVESDKDKCLNLVAKDYLDSISHEVGQKVIIADDCGKIPMGTKAEILKLMISLTQSDTMILQIMIIKRLRLISKQ